MHIIKNCTKLTAESKKAILDTKKKVFEAAIYAKTNTGVAQAGVKDNKRRRKPQDQDNQPARS